MEELIVWIARLCHS